MLSSFTALFLSITIVIILFTCPFIRKTRKGLLLAHYALLFAAHTWETVDSSVIGTSVSTLLLASSVLTLLCEHALTLDQKEFMFDSLYEAFPFILAIGCVDSVAIFLHQNLFSVGIVFFAVGILSVATFLREHPRKTTQEIPIEELDRVAEGTFFYDLENPFNCLGRNGLLHVCVVVSELLIGLVPYASSPEVKSLFIVLECLSLWFILTMPIVVGGFVQTIKLVGRHIVEQQLHRRLLEVEQKDHEDGNKHRNREELLASVEEMFGDEVTMTELV